VFYSLKRLLTILSITLKSTFETTEMNSGDLLS